MIGVIARIFEALHLSPQALSASHVVEVAMGVVGVIATTYVVAEMAVVKPRRTDQPRDDFVNLLVRPLATLSCPPAERHAPSVEVLTHHQWVDHIVEFAGRCSLVRLAAKIPLVLKFRTALVGVNLHVPVIAVSAQILVVRLAAQFHELSRSRLDGKLRLVTRSIADELGVPRAGIREESLLLTCLNVVIALSDRDERHLLSIALRG